MSVLQINSATIEMQMRKGEKENEKVFRVSEHWSL